MCVWERHRGSEMRTQSESLEEREPAELRRLPFNLSATVVSLRTLQSTHRFINETPRINSVSQSHSHSKANIVRRGKMWSNSVRSPPRKEEQTHDSDTRFSALIIICKSHSTVLKCYIWNKRRKTMFSNTKLCFVFGLSVKYWTLFTHFYPWTVIWKELFQKFRRDNVSFSFFFFFFGPKMQTWRPAQS